MADGGGVPEKASSIWPQTRAGLGSRGRYGGGTPEKLAATRFSAVTVRWKGKRGLGWVGSTVTVTV